MKVLFLTTHLDVGGISTYVVTLAKNLQRSGVDVICASAGGRLVSELERSGIVHYEIPIRTKNELHLKLLFAFFKILEIIDKNDITHVHSHTRVSHVVGAFVHKVRTIHYVTTCHGFYKRRILRRLFPAWGDRVIAISYPIREHLVNDFKVSKVKTALVYNGVDASKFNVNLLPSDREELRRYYGIGQEGLIIGGISRLAQVKGYQYLVHALPSVLEKYPDTKVVLIGEGNYKKKLVKIARKYGVENSVYFIGKIEDVSMALEMIDIFVHPCTWQEGFGLAVLEAMAAGKPIIASNVGGLYALVKEDINGWLIPPGDAEALSQALNKLIGSEELLKSMGGNSKRIAREAFSMQKMTAEMTKVYQVLEDEV